MPSAVTPPGGLQLPDDKKSKSPPWWRRWLAIIVTAMTTAAVGELAHHFGASPEIARVAGQAAGDAAGQVVNGERK